MRNLINFLLRYNNFLIFIILEVVAFILIGTTHEYHKSIIWSSANRVVAGSNHLKTSIVEYLQLKEENMLLAEENALLKSQLTELQNNHEIANEIDSQYIYSHLDWDYIPAKVIDISTNKQHNYLILNKGRRDGIQADMGVIAREGIVGIVSTVSDKYSLVIPLIHTKISISCRLRTNGQIGGTSWNGRDYRNINLTHIARHITLNEGDTVVTSGLTPVFPEGLMIGVVEEAILKPSNDYYHATIKLNTDYRQVKYVQVLHNINKEELETIYNGMD